MEAFGKTGRAGALGWRTGGRSRRCWRIGPAAQAAAQNPNVTVDPALLSGIQFRNLDVFSRGGRVTAVDRRAVEPEALLHGQHRRRRLADDATPARPGRTSPTDSSRPASIGAIDVADSDPNVIYVGTGSACPRGNVSPGIGMYKSTDAGKTWQHIGLREAGAIGRIIVHPTNPDLVYVAALGNLFAPNKERGVYRSNDGGKTWQLVHFLSDRTGAVDLTMDPKNPNILIAAMWTTERKPWTIDSGGPEGGMYRTTDGGTTWRAPHQRPAEGPHGHGRRVDLRRRFEARLRAGRSRVRSRRRRSGPTTAARRGRGRSRAARCSSARGTTRTSTPIRSTSTPSTRLNVGAFKSTDGGKTFQPNAIQSHSDHHDLWINPTQQQGDDRRQRRRRHRHGRRLAMDAAEQPADVGALPLDSRHALAVLGVRRAAGQLTIAVPSRQRRRALCRRRRRERTHRRRSARLQHHLRRQLRRHDRAAPIARSASSENVRVYADSQTGQRAADMKYRQQWNAPIRISPHNPDVVYTTSQFVHRTTNAGLDWAVISPDLTRNDKRRQDYSGGEGITRDNTGVEVYSTIFALEESHDDAGLAVGGQRRRADSCLARQRQDLDERHAEGLAGGLHQLDRSVGARAGPRDGGDVSLPPGRHDALPLSRRTTTARRGSRIADGKNGIPNWHFTRVVREDPARRGVLYAGTEFGLYVSFDDGAHWQSFQLNLPITPVTDMMIYRDDLIVTTQGRGFWILSNMGPLRTVKPAMQTPAAPALQARGRVSRRRGHGRGRGAVVLLLAPRSPDRAGHGRDSRREGHLGRDVDGAARHRANSRSGHDCRHRNAHRGWCSGGARGRSGGWSRRRRWRTWRRPRRWTRRRPWWRRRRWRRRGSAGRRRSGTWRRAGRPSRSRKRRSGHESRDSSTCSPTCSRSTRSIMPRRSTSSAARPTPATCSRSAPWVSTITTSSPRRPTARSRRWPARCSNAAPRRPTSGPRSTSRTGRATATSRPAATTPTAGPRSWGSTSASATPRSSAPASAR